LYSQCYTVLSLLHCTASVTLWSLCYTAQPLSHCRASVTLYILLYCTVSVTVTTSVTKSGLR
jgi:hypothetical protein